MIAGPTHFTPLDDHDVLSLQGQYLEADIDTLIDYYAETVRSESGKRDEVSAREYIMPINTPDTTVYIGVEVPKPKISDAEAVVADTERLIDDEDGSYEWDGSYVSVRGTLQPMDDETRQLWEDYFIDAGFSYDDIGLFQPEYINENGYRFYSIDQIEILNTILVLRDLDMPLKEIQTYLSQRSPVTFSN